METLYSLLFSVRRYMSIIILSLKLTLKLLNKIVKKTIFTLMLLENTHIFT